MLNKKMPLYTLVFGLTACLTLLLVSCSSDTALTFWRKQIQDRKDLRENFYLVRGELNNYSSDEQKALARTVGEVSTPSFIPSYELREIEELQIRDRSGQKKPLAVFTLSLCFDTTPYLSTDSEEYKVDTIIMRTRIIDKLWPDTKRGIKLLLEDLHFRGHPVMIEVAFCRQVERDLQLGFRNAMSRVGWVLPTPSVIYSNPIYRWRREKVNDFVFYSLVRIIKYKDRVFILERLLNEGHTTITGPYKLADWVEDPHLFAGINGNIPQVLLESIEK